MKHGSQRKRGRPSIFGRPMTSTERSQRRMAKLIAQEKAYEILSEGLTKVYAEMVAAGVPEEFLNRITAMKTRAVRVLRKGA